MVDISIWIFHILLIQLLIQLYFLRILFPNMKV